MEEEKNNENSTLNFEGFIDITLQNDYGRKRVKRKKEHDPDKPINFAGIIEILHQNDFGIHGGCMVCNFYHAYDTGTLCDPCFMKLTSKQDPPNGRSRVGITASVESWFNVPKPDNVGKSQIFFFTYYPELNFKYPHVPDIDVEGNVKEESIVLDEIYRELNKDDKLKNLYWILHHINGDHFDDRIENHGLILSTEHGVLHHRLMTDRLKSVFTNYIVERNRSVLGKPYWGGEE